MRAMISKLTGTQTQAKLDCSSVMIVYRVKSNLWRGFVLPFDVTYEAGTKEEVVNVLRNMIPSYVEALHQYDHPLHLTDVPLSHPKDQEKFTAIMPDLFNKLLNKVKKVESPDYYAEAQLPA